MKKSIVYSVYKQGEIVAAGDLHDCWRYIVNFYGIQLGTYPVAAALDLAESGVYIQRKEIQVP